MDMDAVTGPVQVVDPEIAEPPKPRTGKTPFNLREKTPWTTRAPLMMVASAGLGALMAAIVVLVWAVVAGPQKSVQPQADSAAAPATAQQDALPPPAAPDAAGLPTGLPGLPAGLAPPGGAAGGAGGANPLAGAFPSRPSVLSGGGGGGSLPALPAFPPPPDLQTTLDALSPYVGPALAQSVTGDAIVSLVGSIGGWATAGVIATANNTTTLLSNIILASAYAGNNPLAIITGAAGAASSLANLPAAAASLLTNPLQGLGGMASSLAVAMPALDALSKLPSIQMPPIGLPAPPPIGLPPIGLPPPPPIGLPPPPPPQLMLAALGL
jgi:hypothetical protein